MAMGAIARRIDDNDDNNGRFAMDFQQKFVADVTEFMNKVRDEFKEVHAKLDLLIGERKGEEAEKARQHNRNTLYVAWAGVGSAVVAAIIALIALFK